MMESSLWSDNWKLPQNYLDPCFHAESPSIWVPTVSTPTKVWSDDIVARCKTLLTHCFFSSSKLASLCLMVRLTIFFSSICLFSPSEDVRNKIEKNCHFHHTHRFHSLSFSCLSGQRVCSYLAFLCSWQRSLVRQSLILIHYRYDSFARDIMYSHGLFDLVLWHPQVYQVLQFVPQLSCGQKNILNKWNTTIIFFFIKGREKYILIAPFGIFLKLFSIKFLRLIMGWGVISL